MKRNQYGINFDLGVPLLSPEEFELLYVELNPEKKQRLIHWIEDRNEGPMIVSGQIGTGKTTLIEKAFQEASIGYDIQIKLDEEVPLYVRGAFWGVFLGKVIELANKLKCNLKPFRLSEDFLGIKYAEKGLAKLVKALCSKPAAISDFTRKKELFNFVDENLDVIKRQLEDIIKILEKKIGRKLFVFAEGIDKFSHYTAEYISLLDLLDFVSKYKTLYEANLIHLLLGTLQKWHNSKKIFLTSASNDQITDVLTRRLGVYSKSRETMLPLLSGLSGGNLRQGLRLLIEYDYAVGEIRKDTKEAVDYACQRVKEDLINISGGAIDPELLWVVHRDKYITSGTLKEFGRRDGSQNAIYQNWILISNEADRELKWPAAVNPLLLPAIEAFKNIPESPEMKSLREWAEAHEASPFGLEIDVSKVEQKNYSHGQKAYFDILSRSEASLMSMTILEIFGNMAAYFLNSERKDKIIIAYENKELVQLTNDFIIGKAGTYNAGNFKDINYDEIPEGPLDLFLNTFQEDQYDGYSIFFEKKLSKSELITLDQRRDAFINHKMIWWIPYDDLKGYFNYWPQLRQFFRIFHLEEDILSIITKADIDQDLLRLKFIDFSVEHKRAIKQKLENVLRTLEKTKSNGHV